MAQSEVRYRKEKPAETNRIDPTSQGVHRQREKKLRKQSPIKICCGIVYKICFVSFFIGLAFCILVMLKSSLIEPEKFSLPHPREFTGPLAVNTKLQQAQRLLEGIVIGPESLAYKNGAIYTGTYDGKIIKIRNDKDIRVLARLGRQPCGKRENEMNCGRPLGVRFIDDKLYVIDAYFGLFEVDITGGSPPIELVSTERSYKGQTLKFTNDFVKLDNGDFIFTDSSYRKYRKDYGLLVLESKGCGRLLWFNPASRMSDLSLDGLYFPNGLQLSPEEDFLLVAETSRYRILKYYLKGPKTGSVEIFIDNLPGMPDNIRPSRNGGYWVGLALVQSRMGILSMDLLAPLPWLRQAIAKVVDPTSLITYTRQYGLIIELNQRGEIVQSLHDPTGEVAPSVSEVLDTGDALYLGSYHSPYLLKLNM